MRRSTLNRRGRSHVEVMAVTAFVGVVGYLAVFVIGGMVVSAIAETIGQNNAYEAVADANYTKPELVTTYVDDHANHCPDADDVVGYHFRATAPGEDRRTDLIVCRASVLSAKPLTVTPAY